jgi:hypothetical protein
MGMRGAALWALAVLSAGCGDSKPGNDGTGLYAANYNPALDPFDENVLTHYQLTMEPADWDAIVRDPWNDTWRRATLEWEGETWHDVAVRASGQRSRVAGNPKPSLRLDFNEFVSDRKFHNPHVSTVKLVSDTNDPAIMRRRIEDGIYRASGLPAPRCVHARLTVNGAYKGVYQPEQRMTKGFLREHFGDAAVNQIYEFSPGPGAFPGHADDVTWGGEDPSLYVPHLFVPELDGLDPAQPGVHVADPVSVRDFVRTVNLSPWSDIAAGVDIDLFCRFMAAEVATGEADGYVAYRVSGSPPFRSSNFRIYFNPVQRKWVVLAWDREEGYWALRDSIFTGFDQRILTRNLILADPGTIARYRTILGELVRGAASVESVDARIDFIAAQIETAVAEDPYKTAGSVENWRAHLQTIRTLVRQQIAMIQSQLDAQ